MKIEAIGEKLIAGTKNSILRAASKIILEDMKQESEAEESGVAESIVELSKLSGMDKSYVASMIIHGFMSVLIGGAIKELQGATTASMANGQKVGNC